MNTQISQDKAKNIKKRASLHRTTRFLSVIVYLFAVLAIVSLLGVIVAVFILGFGKGSETLLYILAGSFAGGSALLAISALLFSKLMTAAAKRELDFRERMDGEESFFVGEGTLFTFEENGVVLHDETGNAHTPIRVPYSEMRFISVCTRRRPAEKGEWCVAVEIPLHYVAKDKKASGEPVLVQTDAKERLFQALRAHNLTLLGETKKQEETKKKFTLFKKFTLPNVKKRRNALLFTALGALLAVAGVLVGVFASVSIGALLGAIGLFLAGKSLYSFFKARAVFSVYREGFYWRDSAGADCLFLKWDDVERVEQTQKDGLPVLCFYCLYGSYCVPAAEGAFETVEEIKKQKEE